MSSEAESMKGEDEEDFSCGLLLRDIEEISKALYLDKSPHKAFNSSYDHRKHVDAKPGISESKYNVVIQDSSNKDKRSSIWNWKKPLKALTHIRNRRFNCCFFLHVHAIEGLPSNFNNLNLCISWKGKADVLRTRPARVCSGIAEFEETLMHRCSVYGSRNGAHNSAKYEPKIFLLHASVIGAPNIDIGNHWIDLSRLLPLKLEELEGDKRSSGKWTTSFMLTGEAKGAKLNVSFGFSITGGNLFEPGYFVKVPDIVRGDKVNHFADSEGSYNQSQSLDVDFIEETLPNQEPELSHSVTLLYQKLDEAKKGNELDFENYEYSESLRAKSEPSHDFNDTEFVVIEEVVDEPTKDEMEKTENRGSQRFDSSVIETIDVPEIFEGEETYFDEDVEWNSKLDKTKAENQSNSVCIIESDFQELESALSTKSLSLDDVAESIENDFLNMLSINESQDDIVSRGSYGKVAFGDDFDLSFAIQSVGRNPGSVISERNAKMLENLETEALMHEWGLNEEAFQYSSHCGSGGFGSPVYLPDEEPLRLPSIGEGVEGSIIWTKDGGFLRSMNPLLFRNAKNGARLIVQVSSPVVFPPVTIMEMLQCLASGGVEKMCIRTNELMPMEDVTGKTMHQVFSEGESRSNGPKRRAMQPECDVRFESDYTSIEDLVPLAITHIEGLLVEGLKIQSCMPDQEAPSRIRIQLAGNYTTERASAFQVPNVDELVKYSVSLEQWFKLDSGEFDAEDDHDETISNLFAAHSGDCDKNFTMGLKVQLRDPLRNYEMVGSSMLALIQVDKKTLKGEEDRLDENTKDFEQKQEKIYESQFKISRVHLAGLNIDKQLWGSSRQRQSGSRWLLSNGMAKSNQNIVSTNSNPVIKCSGLMRNAWSEDVLWSISSPVESEAATWDDQIALNVHVRNPDIIFPFEAVK